MYSAKEWKRLMKNIMYRKTFGYGYLCIELVILNFFNSVHFLNLQINMQRYRFLGNKIVVMFSVNTNFVIIGQYLVNLIYFVETCGSDKCFLNLCTH